MIENITLAQIGGGLALIVGIIAGFSTLDKKLKEYLQSALTTEFEALNGKIDDIHGGLEEEKLETCKNYLVPFLASVERGEAIDETERERYHEMRDKYFALKGNSYIKRKIEKLEGQGKL